MKTIMKRWVLPVLLLAMIVMETAVPVQAKRYSENGTWKKKIGSKTWYFDVNDYTSGTPDDDPNAKYYGVVYIFRGKTNMNKFKYSKMAEYYKKGTNKYCIKYKGGRITFKVYSKYLMLTQNTGTVSGTKLSGKFTLVRRHYS